MTNLTEKEWHSAMTSIYDSAVDASCWERATDVLCGIVGSKSCVLMLTERNDESKPWSMTAQSAALRAVDPARLAEYFRDHAQACEAPGFERLAHLPKHSSVSTEDIERLNPFVNREHIGSQFLIKHFGIYHRWAMRLNDNGAWFDSVAFQFDASVTQIPTADVQRIVPVVTHLAKALDVSRAYRQLQSRYQAVLTVLDHMQVGMLILRHDGDPVVINSEAKRLLEQKDCVTLNSLGRLHFEDDETLGKFNEAIPRLAATANGRGSNESVTFTTPRHSGELPLLVEVTPLRDATNELGDSIHGVSVMLLDPSMGARIRIDGMAVWAELTEAETSVCRHLVDGLTNREIAERRSTSPDTVKTQVAKVFSKCGVANRTDLVRIAYQASPPIAG